MVDIEIKVCSTCKKEKPISEFRSRGGAFKHLLKSRCNKCLYAFHKEWVENNQDKVKDYRVKDKWTILKRCKRRNISPEELVSVYEAQGGCCAICKNKIELNNSAIDHNHSTNEFRGILCKMCNRALGMFKDSEEILHNAIDYLKEKGSYSDNKN